MIDIRRLETLPDTELGPLLAQSQAEGHGMVAKLRKHWISGAQRFDGDGEALYGAYGDGNLVGVGGRAIDPYRNDRRVARVQRLYVLPAWRGQGVGRALMRRIVEEGAVRFATVTVRAPSADAGLFYEALGFAPVSRETETHVLML